MTQGALRGPLIYASLACVTLLCVVPFLLPWHRYPLTSFYPEWLACVLGVGVMAVLLDRRIWSSAEVRAEVPWIALSPFALAALLVVHGALGWSPYFGQALTGALYLIWAGVLVIAARALVRACGTETVLAVAATGLVAGALLSATIGVIQYFNWITPLNAFITRLHSAAIFGNLGQPNHFAAYTTLGLVSLAYLYSRDRMPTAVAALCALPLLFVLGVSGSRSVWLYLLTAFGLAAWLRASSAERAAQRLFWVTGLFLILHYLMQAVLEAGWFKPPERTTVTAIERLFSGADSIAVRLGLWRAAWSIALEHPVLGIGWGAFAGRYFDFSTEPGVTAPLGLYNNAHNILLQLFAETGLIGVVLLLVPLAIWARQALRAERSAAQWWMLATAGVLAIHSLLEYPLWYAHFLGIPALLLGIAATRGFVPQLARLGRLFAAMVMLVGAVNLAFLWADYREFEALFRPTPAQLRNTDVPATMKRLRQNLLLTPYVELSIVVPLEVVEENLAQRLALNGHVIRFTPQPVLVYRQVLLLALAQRLGEAQALLARARRAYPAVPAEFDRDLARLAALHPERFRPLLESAVPVPGQK
ncbi:MAG: Wzy polymerase domain-containing protein [Burkholderiales bacterium]|nr:Wzy polymerase domain-containing protein [Burkholderiales bacterium]